MSIKNQIEFFFTDPAIEAKKPGEFSILYLLRRDIKHCITTKQALWPATMAVLAGIDLLAKFYKGEDQRAVGRRFKSFVDKFFQPISPNDAEIIYQLRNALLHSFGLYSKSKTTEYRFNLILSQSGPIVKQISKDKNVYLISMAGLHERFESAIERYHTILQSDNELQNKFSKMYPYYGTINIAQVPIDK